MVCDKRDDFVDAKVVSNEKACNVVEYSYANISVPVSIAPYAEIGKITSKCYGKAKVTNGNEMPSGSACGCCTFVVSQNICVEIPIEFGTSVVTGGAYIDCLGATMDNKCDCNTENA